MVEAIQNRIVAVSCLRGGAHALNSEQLDSLVKAPTMHTEEGFGHDLLRLALRQARALPLLSYLVDGEGQDVDAPYTLDMTLNRVSAPTESVLFLLRRGAPLDVATTRAKLEEPLAVSKHSCSECGYLCSLPSAFQEVTATAWCPSCCDERAVRISHRSVDSDRHRRAALTAAINVRQQYLATLRCAVADVLSSCTGVADLTLRYLGRCAAP